MTSSTSVTINDTKYFITRTLAENDYCIISLLSDDHDQQYVLKRLRDRTDKNSSAYIRFQNEQSLAANHQHPNLVKTIATGELDGGLFVLSEYCNNGSLQDWLAKTPQLTFADIGQILFSLIDALDHIHQLGIVHRDIKPANIFIRADNSVALGDFGLAKILDAPDTITRTAAIVGTPHYLSPEQVLGKEVSSQSDIYALGILLYQLLTLKLPFQADSSFSIGLMHVNDTPPRVNGELARFDKLIQRMLAKQPDQRPDLNEISTELRKLLDSYPENQAIKFAQTPSKQYKLISALAVVSITAVLSGWIFWPQAEERQTITEPAPLAEEPIPESLVSEDNHFQRTVIAFKTQNINGPMFARGGIDHGIAKELRNVDCDPVNMACAIPIRHFRSANSVWHVGDQYLDWYGAELGQQSKLGAEGSPFTLLTSESALAPELNSAAADLIEPNTQLWVLDIEMDCSKTLDNWFELQTYAVGDGGWEINIKQPDAPFISRNHFAICGGLNVFRRNEHSPDLIQPDYFKI